MSTKNHKMLIPTGLCRCCGKTKQCRVLNEAYQWRRQREVYSEMLVECFGLLLSHLEGDVAERVICLSCVTQLRKSAAFRRQVLSCEEQFLKNKMFIQSDDAISDVKEEKREVKLENFPPTLPSQQSLKLKESYGSDVNDNMDCSNSNVIKEEKEIKKMDVIPQLEPTTNDAADNVNVNEEIDFDVYDSLSLARLKTVKSNETKLEQTKVLKLTTCNMEPLRKVKEKRKRYQRYIDEETIQPQTVLQLEPRRKFLETAEKAYCNTVTVVENSYVCPFTTSFSDFFCTYCRTTFTDPFKLREHTLNHDPTTFKTFYDNKKIAQIDITRIDCRLCDAKINNVDLLKEHLQKEHKKFVFKVSNEFLKFKLSANLSCLECSAGSFQYFHALKKHMAEHFGTCVCNDCGAHFFSEKSLMAHQKSHQKSVELHPCQDCGKTYKSRHERNLHEKRVHKKEAAYPCSKCDEVFLSYALRNRHLIKVHGEERKFNCGLCDRVYDSRKSLREHHRRSHLKIMKHQCDLCDRKFYQPSRLREHMCTHTGERNYRCEYCGKSYPRLRGLKVHMRSHSEEKMYKCQLCKASYSQNVSLKNHLKRHHQSVVGDSSHCAIAKLS